MPDSNTRFRDSAAKHVADSNTRFRDSAAKHVADSMTVVACAVRAMRDRSAGEQRAWNDGRLVVLREAVRLLRMAEDGVIEPASLSPLSRIVDLHAERNGSCVECSKQFPCPTLMALATTP